ncbi:MAG: hypothetical protein M1837_000174 [Sclerophora amabilis]|nr:MAG: hypothetical protein M1837_000174 [Sclerophora amabilis]
MSDPPPYSSVFKEKERPLSRGKEQPLSKEEERPSGKRATSLGPFLPPITEWRERWLNFRARQTPRADQENGPPAGQDELSAALDARADALNESAVEDRALARIGRTYTEARAPKANARRRLALAQRLRADAQSVRFDNLNIANRAAPPPLPVREAPSLPPVEPLPPLGPLPPAPQRRGSTSSEVDLPLRRNPSREARRRSFLTPVDEQQ